MDQVNYVSTINDDVVRSETESHPADIAQMIDYAGHSAYGNPLVPDDILIEEPQHFYTALPRDAFSKAAAPFVRPYTYLLTSQMVQPTQILRKNPGRRSASVSIVGDNTQPPVVLAPTADVLQGLANQLGNYAIGSMQLAGPFCLQPVGQQSPFQWNSTSDLWICQPFVMTNPLYVTVLEYFDA